MPASQDSAPPAPAPQGRPPRGRPARAPLPDIDPARCTGCGRCIAVCPEHVLAFETVRWTKFAVLVAADPCTGCSRCETRCPFNAITMRPASQVRPCGG